jgi:type I restriction enzyme S subunit
LSKWPEIQLRRLTTCLDGKRVPLNSTERAEVPGDYPYWGANGVVDTVGDYLFDEELVLLGEDGAPFGDPLKDVAFLVQGRVWVNNHIHALRPTSTVNARFLAYALNTVDWPRYISGSTREKLTQDDMARAKVPYPTLRNQWAIADFLDIETNRIDALIQKKERMIELMDERWVAVLDVWVETQCQQHGTVPLRRLVSRIEQGWSPECEAVEADPGEWGVLKTSAVTSGAFCPSQNKRLPASIAPDLRWSVSDGDLLVIRGSGSRGSVGQAVVARPGARKLMISDLIYRVVAPRCDPDYLASVLRSRRVRDVLEGSIRTDAGQTLKVRVDDLKGLPIPAVPPVKQSANWRDLRRLLSSLEELRGVIFCQMELLREHRQALITAVVTGQLTVPGVAAA